MLDSNLFENQIYLCLAIYFVTKNLAKSSLILILFLFHSLSTYVKGFDGLQFKHLYLYCILRIISSELVKVIF